MAQALDATVLIENRIHRVTLAGGVESVVISATVEALGLEKAYAVARAYDDGAAMEVPASVFEAAEVSTDRRAPSINGRAVPQETAEAVAELRERLLVYGSRARVFIG